VQYSLEKLRSYDLNQEFKTYYIYMSEPKSIQVKMVSPASYTAKTKEKPFPRQQHFEDVVVGYTAYSPAGDVTADLVYVNYGVLVYYARLAELGVNLQGMIAIARNGKVFWEVKNKVAAEHGALGLILFSDPKDDGCLIGLSTRMAPGSRGVVQVARDKNIHQ